MLERRTPPWVMYALVAVNVAMFVVELAHGVQLVTPTLPPMVELGASYAPLTLGGEWWRLGTSMFLHFGVLHLALNMMCLYQARVVEHLFGHRGFLAVYLLAGLGGGVASLLASPSTSVIAGASGAVFGLYGAFGAFLVLRRAEIQADSWRRTARSLALFLALNLIIGLSLSGVSVSAHIAGFLIGFVVGAGLLVRGGRAPAPVPAGPPEP